MSNEISQLQINGTTYDLVDATVRDSMSWIWRNDTGNIHFKTGIKNGVYKEYSFEPTGILYAKIYNEDGTAPDNSAWRPVAHLNIVEDNDHQSTALYASHNTEGTTYRWMFSEYGNIRRDSSTDGGNTWTVDMYYPHFEYGYVSTTVAKQNYADKIVTFSRPFKSTPVVVCNFGGASTAYQMGNVSCTAMNISTTGFTIRVWNADTTSREPRINWIAFV